jgi:alpha,alpha-trehalase
LIRFLLLVLLATSTTIASAAEVPDSARTLAYIHRAWGTLTRSATDCASYRGPYQRGEQVLYVPKDLPMPRALQNFQKRCGVEVLRLPVRIRRLGDVQPAALERQGLLYLPHPYVVPGGFFNEMFGWDSYFIELGLIADHRDALARDMVENMLFEVAHYGGVLNANSSYYLSRSQPPFLGEMVRALLLDQGAFRDQATATAWLRHAYPLVVENYSIWQRVEHRAANTGLSRYFDYGGHDPDIDAAYAREVIRFLVAHPGEDDGYLIKSPQHPSAAEAATLADESCDLHAADACADAWYEGYRLTAKFYRGDRAMRESGFDVSFRFGPFSGSTTDYAPVGLNSLLYRYELDLRDFAQRLGLAAEPQRWTQVAAVRKQAIDRYLWNPALGLYTDYDFVTRKPSYYAFITTFYPLWVGAASRLQAQAVRDNLPLFERAGGLQTSTSESGAQWDAPFGWAPTNWLSVSGLDTYGYDVDARRIAAKFIATVDRGLADDGTIREKYNMSTGNADVRITAGYAQNVIGFGWTNAVYLKLEQLRAGTNH